MAGDEEVGLLLEESAAIMARLRGPGGCPWDREQTPETLRKYTLEETYEVLDAIEREDWPHLEEELGDLLLQVLFYARIADEAGHFSLGGVLAGLNRKLVRRHPHVFGVAAAAAAGGLPAEQIALGLARADASGGIDTAMVLANWASIKAAEKTAKAASTASAAKVAQAGAAAGVAEAGQRGGYLDEVLRGQAALSEAAQLGKAAARAGFDWPSAAGLVAKVREEADEVEAELALMAHARDPAHDRGIGRPPAVTDRLREEVGDLLFTAANLARHLKVEPELALRDANAKFRRRFRAMEGATARLLEELTANELEEAWARVKQLEARA